MAPKPVPQDRRGPRAFFGRRAGKTLHRGQRGLIETLLPDLTIDISKPLDLETLFRGARRIHIEIGYGGGEHLARLARENSEDGFIGCEVFTGGIGKMLEAIEKERIGNIALFSDDAIKLLAALPEGRLDAAYLLYPDPWPKPRHHKRRFVQDGTLSALARTLRPGAVFRFATDIEDYADWTLAHILRSPAFIWPPCPPASWHTPYPGWRPTRYEEKARRQGRAQSFYFEFRRV